MSIHNFSRVLCFAGLVANCQAVFALEEVDTVKLKKHIEDSKILIEQHKSAGNFEQAYKELKELKVMSDSLWKIKVNEGLLKQKHDIQKKENDLLMAESIKNSALLEIEKDFNNKQNELYRIGKIGFISLIATAVSILLAWLYVNSKRKKLKKVNQFLLREASWLKHSPVVIFDFIANQHIDIIYVSDNIEKFNSNQSDKLLNAANFIKTLDNSKQFLNEIEQRLKNGDKNFVLHATKSSPNDTIQYFDFYFKVSDHPFAEGFRVNAYMIDNSELKILTHKFLTINKLIQNTNLVAGVGGWSYDIKTKDMFWTDYIYQLHGLNKDFKPSPKVNIQYYHGAEQQNKIRQYFKNAVKNGIPFDDEFELVTTSGEVKKMRVAAKPVYENQELVRIDGIIQDITLRKLKEEELKKTYLLAAKQNKQLQSFAYIVSHNLRSNVANFEGIIQLLKQEENPQQKQLLLNALITNSERLKETLHNLNEVIQVQGSSMEHIKKIDVIGELKKICKGLEFLIQNAGAEVTLHYDDEPFIYHIPAYFESIFQNLITNAIKYRSPKRTCKIDIVITDLGDKVKVSVCDNGLGIDLKNHRDKLFGMFKTFHKNEDATGLGLFLVKNQVESIGGHIEVESTPGVGTEFSVYLIKKNEHINIILN